MLRHFSFPISLSFHAPAARALSYSQARIPTRHASKCKRREFFIIAKGSEVEVPLRPTEKVTTPSHLVTSILTDQIKNSLSPRIGGGEGKARILMGLLLAGRITAGGRKVHGIKPKRARNKSKNVNLKDLLSCHLNFYLPCLPA